MMDNKQLFELAVSMVEGTPFSTAKGKTISDRKSKEKAFVRVIQSFIHGVKTEGKEIQAFTGSSDVAQLTKDVFNVTNQVPNYDLEWQRAFKTVGLMKGQLSWEIATASTSAQFELVPEGGKIKFEKFDGTKVTVSIAKYGMGIGLTWETVEGRKMYQFIDQLEQTRAKLYDLWANVHYGLLATASTSNQIAWQGSGAILDRDIATINKGYEDLGEATKDKGYGDTANAEMLLYVSPKLKARVLQALNSTELAIANANGQRVVYNVTPIFTWNSQIPANKGILVLPGNKIQNSVYMENMALTKQDNESLSDLYSYWTAFGGTVADSDQTFELAFA
jgi:hypothetical protein